MLLCLHAPSAGGLTLRCLLFGPDLGLNVMHYHWAMLQSRRAWEDEGIVLRMGTSPPRQGLLVIHPL